MDPKRLKFGNKKLSKGAEVHCCKGHGNVLTGETPEFMVNGDFCNTHSIVGFCGINKKAPAMLCTVHDEKRCNKLPTFLSFAMQQFMKTVRTMGLEDWLWQNHGVAVVHFTT